VAVQTKARVCGHSLPVTAGSNAVGGGGGQTCLSVVCVVCCHVEVSGIGMITCVEESYRLWCISVCDAKSR